MEKEMNHFEQYNQYRNGINFRKVSRSIALVVLLVFIITPAFSQNKNDSTVFDYSRPGKSHQMLADLAGNWTFIGRHFSGNLNPDSNKVVSEFKGRVTRTPFAYGRFFIAEITGDGTLELPIQDGKMITDTVRNIEIEGYDNVKRKFIHTFINNHIGSAILFWQGDYDPATKTILYQTELEPMPGRKMKSLERFIIIDNDHYKKEYYREREGKMIKASETVCTRVGKK